MVSIDPATPIPGQVAHVYVERAPGAFGNGMCICGKRRFTGIHVANDGTPEPDLEGIHEQLDLIAASVESIRTILGARP